MSRTFYDHKGRRLRDLSCGDTRSYLEIELRRVWCRSCGAVKQETLPWVAAPLFDTQRLAWCVGRRCRPATLQAVARELPLDGKTVKEVDNQYRREQVRRVGPPAPRVLGIDEIALRKGHPYRVVVRTWGAGVPSGSAARLARQRAWPWSRPGWGPRKASRVGWW